MASFKCVKDSLPWLKDRLLSQNIHFSLPDWRHWITHRHSLPLYWQNYFSPVKLQKPFEDLNRIILPKPQSTRVKFHVMILPGTLLDSYTLDTLSLVERVYWVTLRMYSEVQSWLPSSSSSFFPLDPQKQPGSDAALRAVVIQESRLHVGVHNGWCFLDKPQVVILEPLVSGPRGRADSTSKQSKDRWARVSMSTLEILINRVNVELTFDV